MMLARGAWTSGSAAHKRSRLGSQVPKIRARVSSSPTHVRELGTSGSLPKCRKSGSLDVGERSAQKIKIGGPSTENPGKGVEFSYARRGAWHVGEPAKIPQIWELPNLQLACSKTMDPLLGVRFRFCQMPKSLPRPTPEKWSWQSVKNSTHMPKSLPTPKSATGLQ